MGSLGQGEHHHSDGSFHSWSGVQAGKKTQFVPSDKKVIDDYDEDTTTLYSYGNLDDVNEAYRKGGSNVQQFPPVKTEESRLLSMEKDSAYNPEVDMGIDKIGDYGSGDNSANVGGSQNLNWVDPATGNSYAYTGTKNPQGSLEVQSFATPEGLAAYNKATRQNLGPDMRPVTTTPSTTTPSGTPPANTWTPQGDPENPQENDRRLGPGGVKQTYMETGGWLTDEQLEGRVGLGFVKSAVSSVADFVTAIPEKTNLASEYQKGMSQPGGVEGATELIAEGDVDEQFDWEGAPVGTVHESGGMKYKKEETGWKEVTPMEAAAEPSTVPTKDAPAAQMQGADGKLIGFHNPMQWQNNTNELTKLMNNATTSKTGGDFRALQKEVSKAMKLPPNYTVRESANGQIFIEWDETAERKAREYNAAQPSEGGDLMEVPQRLSPENERDVTATAQNYYTQLARANQLLTSRYNNQFEMEILDKELLKKATELDLEERRVKVTEDEYLALYGPDGLEGMKYEALYGAEGLEDKKFEAMYGYEGIERAKLTAEKDLAQKQLMLEAGIIVFDSAKAYELGLVNPTTGEIRKEFQTLSKQLQDRQLAIQEAQMKGTTRVQKLNEDGTIRPGEYEDIATAQQRNQHVIEAQQYANSLTEQSGMQTLVQPSSERQGDTRMTSQGTIVGEYGDYVVVQTQTSTFAREQFSEAISARKNQQAIEQDRIDADREISERMEQLRLTGISTEAATAQSIANTNAESAKAVAQLRLDAEKTGIDNELTLLETRIELEVQREGQTLTRQEIARQAEITMQIELSKQRIIEEAAQRGTELDAQIAERLATLQIQKEIGTENSANALAQVNARMEAEQTMLTERLGSEEARATEAIESAETIALAQAAARVTLSADEQADALARLEAQIEANATAQGLQLDSEELRANAQLLMQKEIATLGGTQATAQITAQTAAEKQRLQDRLATEKGFVDEQREALAIATDPTVVAQARQVATNFVSSLNEALGQGVQGNFSQAASAMAAELPPAPPGIMWDSTSGRFIQRPGFEGREMAATTQEWISATTGAYKARDRAEQAVREGTRLRTESQLREQERQQADEDFRQAMLTADIDTAEEAITRQRMAETSQLQNQTKLDNLQMLFGLLANPVQLGFAKKHGLLGQIEAVLGFAIGNVPQAAVGPTIPNINQWQTMDSEQQAFSIADFVEQGGSPTAFMQMVQGAAPAQTQQVQYGVL